MYLARHDNKCDKRDAVTVDGQPTTSRGITASCCGCCSRVYIPRICSSCSSDTQLKMYSIETRQQVRGINLSSMVGYFAHTEI